MNERHAEDGRASFPTGEQTPQTCVLGQEILTFGGIEASLHAHGMIRPCYKAQKTLWLRIARNHHRRDAVRRPYMMRHRTEMMEVPKLRAKTILDLLPLDK